MPEHSTNSLGGPRICFQLLTAKLPCGCIIRLVTPIDTGLIYDIELQLLMCVVVVFSASSHRLPGPVFPVCLFPKPFSLLSEESMSKIHCLFLI